MFCEKCGMKVSDNEPFCLRCGNKMKAQESAPNSNMFFAAGDLEASPANCGNTFSHNDTADAPTAPKNDGSGVLRVSASLRQSNAKRDGNAAYRGDSNMPPVYTARPVYAPPTESVPETNGKENHKKPKKLKRAPLICAVVLAVVLIGAGVFAAMHFLRGNEMEKGKTENLREDIQTGESTNSIGNLQIEGVDNAMSEKDDAGMRFAEKVATLYMHGDYVNYAKYTAYDLYAGEKRWYEKLAKDSGRNQTYLEKASELYQQNFGTIEEVLECRHNEQEKTLTERFGSYQLDNYVYLPISYSGQDLTRIKARIEAEASSQEIYLADDIEGYDMIDTITVLKVEHKFVGKEIAWNTKYVYLVGENERKVLWLTTTAPELPAGKKWGDPVKISGDSGTDAMLDDETALELAKAYLASHSELTGGAAGWGTSVRTPILINGKYYYRIHYLHPESKEAIYEYYLEIYTGEVYSEDALR